jgi:hypothetical protein
METSIQAEVEAAVEKKLANAKEILCRKKANGAVMNPFFSGVAGDSLLAHEEKLLFYLQKEDPDHDYLIEGLPFCLPCDILEEVRCMSYYVIFLEILFSTHVVSFPGSLQAAILSACTFPSLQSRQSSKT